MGVPIVMVSIGVLIREYVIVSVVILIRRLNKWIST